MPHDRLGDLPTLSHLCLSDLEEAAVFKKDPVQYMMRMVLTLSGVEQASTWFLA
jgi:hypothetical protein